MYHQSLPHQSQLRGDLEATEKAFQSLMGRYNALKTLNENLHKACHRTVIRISANKFFHFTQHVHMEMTSRISKWYNQSGAK
jgi:hypothetical protein